MALGVDSRMMSEHRFGYMEHTADKGVYAYGDTLSEAFEDVAYGVFALMADLARYQRTEIRNIEVSGYDEQSMLRAWLNELLFMFEVERLLPVEFKAHILEGVRLEATVGVRPFGPDIEWLGPQVKAVTYHELEIGKTEDGYRVQVIVDV